MGPLRWYARRMTGPRSQFEADSAATVTGVASGGLGTGANLEDTQVFRTEDLAEAAASPAEPVATPTAAPAAGAPHAAAPVDAATAEPVPARLAPAPVAEPIAGPVPAAPVRSAVVPRRNSPNRPPGRGIAGLLAAALVVLAGVAFVVSRDDATLDAGQALPSAAEPATAAPDANADGGNGGNGGNGDNDRGKDKDKPCNGNGRGNGCGGDDDD